MRPANNELTKLGFEQVTHKEMFTSLMSNEIYPKLRQVQQDELHRIYKKYDKKKQLVGSNLTYLIQLYITFVKKGFQFEDKKLNKTKQNKEYVPQHIGMIKALNYLKTH